MPKVTLRSHAFYAALLSTLIPLLLLRRVLNWDIAPGIPDEPLFEALSTIGIVEGWLTAQDFVVFGATEFWPDNLLFSFFGALFALVFQDDGLALGVLLFFGICSCGFGAWSLARKILPENSISAFVAIGLVQLTPPILRSAWSADLAILGLGIAALAISARSRVIRGILALLTGFIGLGAALLAIIGSLLINKGKTKFIGLLSLIPLLLAAFMAEPSIIPGSIKTIPQVDSIPAYVSMGQAVLPLGSSEQKQVEPAKRSISQIPARLHGGPVVIISLIAAISFKPSRKVGIAGLLVIMLITIFEGFFPLPGENSQPNLDLSFLPSYKPLLSDWMAMPIVGAGIGAAILADKMWPLAVVLGMLVISVMPTSLIDPKVPVTNLPEDPVVKALIDLNPGPVLHLPEPSYPFLQSSHSRAEILYLATKHGHPVWFGITPHPDPALIGEISALTDLATDQRSAAEIWNNRTMPAGISARKAGFVALIVDRKLFEKAGTALTEKFGPPLAESDVWAVHILPTQ